MVYPPRLVQTKSVISEQAGIQNVVVLSMPKIPGFVIPAKAERLAEAMIFLTVGGRFRSIGT